MNCCNLEKGIDLSTTTHLSRWNDEIQDIRPAMYCPSRLVRETLQLPHPTLEISANKIVP